MDYTTNQKTDFQTELKKKQTQKQDPTILCLQKTHVRFKYTNGS